MEEKGIKYVVFYKYKKKLNGKKYDMVRIISSDDAYNDSLEEAKEVIVERASRFNNPIKDYYIAVYDWNNYPYDKLEEIHFE